MSGSSGSRPDRIDWSVERDRIDLAQVVTNLLGPAPGRRGDRNPKRLWWPCPFHGNDSNPSLAVDIGKSTWKCHACGERGDAATIVMKLERLTFPEALDRLVTGTRFASHAAQPSAPPRRSITPETPSGLPHDEAIALVESAAVRLWSPEGASALRHLIQERGLSPETIRGARLGWTPRVSLPRNDGTRSNARGVVVPWFEGERLALVKVRQPEGVRPKYREAFRDRAVAFPGPDVAALGLPMIVVEGEFDALLLGQELAELASVLTLGSASMRLTGSVLNAAQRAPAWYIATDADPAGDRAAQAWPGRARRVHPPGSFKDWGEARAAGVNLHRWWTDRLAGVEQPDLFSWDELSTWRWAGADDTPGIDIDRPWMTPETHSDVEPGQLD